MLACSPQHLGEASRHLEEFSPRSESLVRRKDVRLREGEGHSEPGGRHSCLGAVGDAEDGSDIGERISDNNW